MTKWQSCLLALIALCEGAAEPLTAVCLYQVMPRSVKPAFDQHLSLTLYHVLVFPGLIIVCVIPAGLRQLTFQFLVLKSSSVPQ